MFRLEECVFLSIMRTCGLVRQKIINGKTSIYVEKEKWNEILWFMWRRRGYVAAIRKIETKKTT